MSFSVLRSARLISVLTLISRVAGLLRDMAFSYTFGVGSVQSALALAFQVPNLFRRLFGEGALSAASIPVLTETLQRQGRDEMDVVVGRLIGLLLMILTFLCILAELVVAVLYILYRSNSDTALTLGLTALLLPYMILICTGAVLGGIENVFGRFALPAATPIIVNAFQIVGAYSAPYFFPGNERRQVVLACITILLAGTVQLWLQWRAVHRCGLTMRIGFDYGHQAIRRIGVTMIPMVLGLGAVQLNTLADSLIAWWFIIEPMGPGIPEQRPGTAILYLAQHLYQFPLGVFLVALATAIFPALARHATDNDIRGLSDTLAKGIRIALFISIPCMVGMILVRQPLVRALFHRGAFTNIPGADIRVANAMAMYVIALWAYGLNHLVIRAFYSLQDARTPLYTSVANVFLNVTLNLILVQTPLKEAGLALATSIGATVQLAVMVVLLRRRIGRMGWTRTIPSVMRTALASVIMAAAVMAVDHWVTEGMSSAIRLMTMVIVGAGGFLLMVVVLHCEEFHELLKR